MKVLWLTSWYPNKVSPTNGDFVQRHAQATSLFCKVDIIHVEKDTNNLLDQSIEIKKMLKVILVKQLFYLRKINCL